MNVNWSTLAFVALMLALTGVFVALGIWQLQRLRDKETTAAVVAERAVQPPRPLPPLAEWVGFDEEVFEHRPVTVTGTFVPGYTVLVFTNLSNARGEHSGPGYWVVNPFRLVEGGYVLVNRGFVPQPLGRNFVRSEVSAASLGPVTVAGIARKSEAPSSFTPGPDRENRIEWVMNVPRLAALMPEAFQPLAPIVIDMAAGDPGALPQGGETVVSVPNNHLGYAITWFGFALLTPILLAFWLFRRREKPAEP